jgi:hypothetical protein
VGYSSLVMALAALSTGRLCLGDGGFVCDQPWPVLAAPVQPDLRMLGQCGVNRMSASQYNVVQQLALSCASKLLGSDGN